MLWFRKGKPAAEFRTVDLPGNIGSVSVPADFTVEMEDDATLLACPREREMLSLRFSSLSFVMKGGGEDGGRASVRDKAMKGGLEYYEVDDKGIVSYADQTQENGTPLVVRFWEVGTRNTIVIISATILRARQNDGAVRSVLDKMPSILRSVQVRKVRRIIEDNGRRVEATVETTDEAPSTFAAFGKEEETWLATNLALARKLGLKYGSGGELGPEELDRIFSRWMHEENEKEAAELVANALGAAFGTWLVDRHDFRWGVLTDADGTEYAVKHKLGETMAYPRALVQKRIESKQPEFFHNVYLIILDQLRRFGEQG